MFKKRILRWMAFGAPAALVGLFLFVPFLPALADAPGQNEYLEVPVIGHIGDQVRPAAIEECLKYAAAQGIKHVVFYVDSQGGNTSAGYALYRILEKYDQPLHYVSVVRDAVGVSMVFPLWSRDIFVRPGASMGGVALTLDPASLGEGVTTQILLSNIALNASLVATRHGHPAELVRAMIDPGEPTSVWRDRSGTWRSGAYAPTEAGPTPLYAGGTTRALLVLGEDQAVDLGLARPFNGPIDLLGRELGLAGWASAGDAGRTLIASTGVQPNRTVAKALPNRAQVEQNLKRREAAKADYEECLHLADKWDPRKEAYSTIRESATWWGGGSADTGRLTYEARREWQALTDLRVQYLLKARKALEALGALDQEAKRLGIEPTYPDGKREEMKTDLNIQINLAVMNHDKKHLGDRTMTH